MRPCPHCGQEVAAAAKLCPHCGTEVNTERQPTPSGRPPEIASAKHDGTQVDAGLSLGCVLSAVAYFFLGAFAIVAHNLSQFPRGHHFHMPLFFRYGTWTINFVPLAIVSGLYFLLRSRFPSFARGLGYCLLVIGVLLLWGLATCRS